MSSIAIRPKRLSDHRGQVSFPCLELPLWPFWGQSKHLQHSPTAKSLRQKSTKSTSRRDPSRNSNIFPELPGFLWRDNTKRLVDSSLLFAVWSGRNWAGGHICLVHESVDSTSQPSATYGMPSEQVWWSFSHTLAGFETFHLVTRKGRNHEQWLLSQKIIFQPFGTPLSRESDLFFREKVKWPFICHNRTFLRFLGALSTAIRCCKRRTGATSEILGGTTGSK